MKQPHSYESCYKILNIEDKASWDDLRKSYRSLIQKWHPDRYMDDVGKSEANDKLKDLNTAYKVLSDYYKRNNTLPLYTRNIPPSTEQKPTVQPKKKVKQSSIKKNIAATKRKNNIQHIFTVSLVFIIIAFFYQYLDSIIVSFSTPLEYSKEETIDKTKIKKMKKEDDSKYFTYGSSLGEVIYVQGPPDRTVENVWFYGNSEVHFKGGHVVKWIRTSSMQLKARDILTDQ